MLSIMPKIQGISVRSQMERYVSLPSELNIREHLRRHPRRPRARKWDGGRKKSKPGEEKKSGEENLVLDFSSPEFFLARLDFSLPPGGSHGRLNRARCSPHFPTPPKSWPSVPKGR